MLTHVAIKVSEYEVASLPRPNRHMDITLHADHRYRESNVCGFLTEDGTFLDCREALIYAIEHGQIPAPHEIRSNELSSQELW